MRCTESANPRILVIRPSALGDVCRTVPVLASLRAAFPNAQIDWMVQDSFADAVACHPALSNVISFPRKGFSDWWRNIHTLTALRAWLRDLKAQRYDVVYDCQGLFRSAFFALMSGAPRRIGFADARELGFLGCNVRRRVDPALHTVERMLALLPPEGVTPQRDMRLYTAQSHETWWQTHTHALGWDSAAPYVILAPTSRWPSKRWPQSRFIELIGLLQQRNLTRIAVVGSPGEASQCADLIRLCDGAHVINLIGATSVGQLMTVVRNSRLVIANDSAVLHMAVGFSRPYVGLYGPTDVARVGPYVPPPPQRAAPGIVLQHVEPNESLHHKNPQLADGRIMARISAQEVIGAVDQLIS